MYFWRYYEDNILDLYVTSWLGFHTPRIEPVFIFVHYLFFGLYDMFFLLIIVLCYVMVETHRIGSLSNTPIVLLDSPLVL